MVRFVEMGTVRLFSQLSHLSKRPSAHYDFGVRLLGFGACVIGTLLDAPPTPRFFMLTSGPR